MVNKLIISIFMVSSLFIPLSLPGIDFDFDLLEDLSTFRLDPNVVDISGNPPPVNPGDVPYGTGFIVRGALYKAGTLRANNCTGNNACDLSNETPIGLWICFGRLTTDFPSGGDPNGPATVGAQYFYFFDERGMQTSERGMVSPGLIFGVAVPGNIYVRPVTGGTGPFRFAKGDMKVEIIGNDGATISTEYRADIKGIGKGQIKDLLP